MKAWFYHFFIVLMPVCAQAGLPARSGNPNNGPESLTKPAWQSIRAAYEAGRHAFRQTATGWQARNPGQQWTTKFDERGFVAGPRDGAWQWGLELKSYGRGDKQTVIAGRPAVNSEGQRLSYQWDAAMQEWWVNDARGLEHGFTVKERPAAPGNDESATLNLLLATRGTLRPTVTADARGVLFLDAGGATVLTYTGLKVWDADHKVLPARFEAAKESTFRILVDEREARYPLTIDPIAQQAYLKPAAIGTTQAGDRFGASVAISGDTVVVGAPQEDSGTTGVNSIPDESAGNAGAAYVFVCSSGVWTQQAYLKPAAVGTTQAGDQFGYSVAVSGDTIVIGAYGEDSNSTGVNSTPDESAGNAGAAYVFIRNAGVWSQQGYLKPAAVGTSQSGDQFGYAVAVSGDTVVVGANLEDSSTTGVNSAPNDSTFSAGAACVFIRTGTTWSQQAYLKPAAIGTSQANDQFGWSVAISGDTVVAGALFEDSDTTGVNGTPEDGAGALFDSGAACVFVRSAGVWTQQAFLKPSAVGATQNRDFFGYSVAVSNDTVVVGAIGENSSTTGVNSTANESAGDSGAAYVFMRSAGAWTQQAYLKPAAVGTTQVNDFFGYSVAISGDTIVAGAYAEDSNTTGVNSTPEDSGGTAFDSGAACVFVRNAGVWTQRLFLKSPAAGGTTHAGDVFGWSVAVSGDAVVVGAFEEDSSTTGVNSTPNESAATSGAAYTFSLIEQEMIVEQPAGANLTAGTASVAFGGRPSGNPGAAKMFTIRNAGALDLTLAAPAVTGGAASDFSVDTAGTLLIIPGGQQTNFSVTFTAGAAGARSTTLRIPNNDPDENPFDITLTGTGLLITQDTDNDGMNDVAEFNLSALGFDWQAAQPALVNTYYAGANSAGLYTTSQVQALHMDVPLIQRHPATGRFTFTFGLQKSPSLMPGSYVPFPFIQSDTTVNGAGKVEFQFTSPDNAAFFRIEPP